MSRDPNDDDRYALYQHAHQDLWWAKSQQWNAANWGLLLVAGIVGAARTIIPRSDLFPARTWPFLVLVVAVALASGWYLSRLHASIVHNRRVYRALEKQTGIGELRNSVPKAAGEETDRTRGREFLYVMCGAFGIAAGLGVNLLGVSSCLSFFIGAGVALIDAGLVRAA